MKKHYRKENDCLNCGTILEGKFCHNCGQENLQMKESFGHMIVHAVSDYFHFDDQFFHTLKPLLFEPGKLTNEYVAGRRAHYLHPVKMYIFISLLFFIVLFSNKKADPFADNKAEHTEQTVANKTKDQISEDINKNPNLNIKQKQEITNTIKSLLPEKGKKELEANLRKDSLKKANNPNFKSDDKIIFFDNDDGSQSYEAYLKNQAKLPANKQDGWLMRYVHKKNNDWSKQGKNAREILIEGLKHNAPKMMFLLLPLFALILKLAFWNNRKFYVEHMIYSIHLHCFLFLFLSATTLLSAVTPDSWHVLLSWVSAVSTIVILWYIYRSLRVVYNRSRWRTISKMIGVGIMYSVVFGLCFIAMLVITAITTV